MKKIILALAIIASNFAYGQGGKPSKIVVTIGGQQYELQPVSSQPTKKKVVKPKTIEKKILVETKDTSEKTKSNFSPVVTTNNTGHVIVNGVVNGNITIVINKNKSDSITGVQVSKDTLLSPAPTKPIVLNVVKTRAYQVFLDSRKDERVRPNQYVYRDYESTNSFRKLRKRLKKALYPVEKAGSASEFLLTEAGQTLLKKERGVHNIINVRNAGIIDMYIKGDTLIADFHSERYSATDSTGKMRIFYRK